MCRSFVFGHCFITKYLGSFLVFVVVDLLFFVPPIACGCSVLSLFLVRITLCLFFSFAIILTGMRELLIRCLLLLTL